MPTNPVRPSTEAAIDRLTLGIESPRGAQASHGVVALPFACFETEASGLMCGVPMGTTCACFEAEPSAQYCTPCCSCLETE